MALSPGARLTHYEVGSLIGAGGMGEVYQARDTTLARDVALKVIPDGFARDRERLVRFDREAKLLASLNHPNIAAIHSFEREGDVQFFVMELVRGKTLAEILASGPLSLEDAVSYFRQVAEALEAAHERGIVHRDLKPANVMVTPEGKIKVLDFGLAKAFEETPSEETDPSQSPTREGTRTAVILGTAPYMSPEQARGKKVDKLTDVWSFGCVLYEALTGRPAFHGEAVTDTLAAVVRAEPDWSVLPASTPPAVLSLLNRCLRKDPARRLHDMADVRIELEEPSTEAAPAPRVLRPLWKAILPWGVSAMLLALVVAAPSRRATESHPVTRLELTLPANVELFSAIGAQVALSSDGKTLAYIGMEGATRQVHLRPLDQSESKAISGSDIASSVSFTTHDDSLILVQPGVVKETSLSGRPRYFDGSGSSSPWSECGDRWRHRLRRFRRHLQGRVSRRKADEARDSGIEERGIQMASGSSVGSCDPVHPLERRGGSGISHRCLLVREWNHASGRRERDVPDIPPWRGTCSLRGERQSSRRPSTRSGA
jgi:eukaryotic-like serine/threonine-protein kinase